MLIHLSFWVRKDEVVIDLQRRTFLYNGTENFWSAYSRWVTYPKFDLKHYVEGSGLLGEMQRGTNVVEGMCELP